MRTIYAEYNINHDFSVSKTEVYLLFFTTGFLENISFIHNPIINTPKSDHIINPVILFLLTNRIKSHHNETMSLLQILYQLS